MLGYLGQVCRSGHRLNVKVTRSKIFSMGISMEWLLEIIDVFSQGKKNTRNTIVQLVYVRFH